MLRMPALWWETDHGLIPPNMHNTCNLAKQDSAKCDEPELCTKELGEWCCMGSRSRKQRERKNCDRPEMNAVENCSCHGSLQFHGRWKWCIAWLTLRLWFFSPNRCPEISWGSSNHTAKALDHCAFWGARFPEHDVSKACIWKPAGAQWKARIE